MFSIFILFAVAKICFYFRLFDIFNKTFFTWFVFLMTAVVHYLLEENDTSMITPQEYIEIHEKPFDTSLESGKCISARKAEHYKGSIDVYCKCDYFKSRDK